MIKEILTEISAKYLEEKKNSMANNSFADLVRKASEQYIKPNISKNRDHFIYKSSPGRPPNWAAVPWIAIFDPNVTTSPQRGYYITYLFSVDMKRVYLNLTKRGFLFNALLLTMQVSLNILKRKESRLYL